jgi:hypothetical protein
MVLLAPVTNWEPHGVRLAAYCYDMRYGMKVQIVTPYRVSHLQRYGFTVRGNVTKCVPTLILVGFIRMYSCFSSARWLLHAHMPLYAR